MFNKKYILLFAVGLSLIGCGQKATDDIRMTENQNQKSVVQEKDNTREDIPKEIIEESTELDEAEKTKEKELKEEKMLEEKGKIQEQESERKEDSVPTQQDFYSLEFDENSDIFARIKGKSYKDNCTVPVSDLRYLHVMHIGFDGQPHDGEIICNKYIANDLLEIFEALYEAQYPIEKIRLVDEYNADDESSMADNNSSSFNFRFISYTTKISKHGYGLAMDINTL